MARPPVIARRPVRRSGVAALWSLVALLAVATAVAAIVLGSREGAPRSPISPVPTRTPTTQTAVSTGPRPFPTFTR